MSEQLIGMEGLAEGVIAGIGPDLDPLADAEDSAVKNRAGRTPSNSAPVVIRPVFLSPKKSRSKVPPNIPSTKLWPPTPKWAGTLKSSWSAKTAPSWPALTPAPSRMTPL